MPLFSINLTYGNAYSAYLVRFLLIFYLSYQFANNKLLLHYQLPSEELTCGILISGIVFMLMFITDRELNQNSCLPFQQKPATLPEENFGQWKEGEVKVSVTSSKSEMKPREITVIEKQNLLGETEKTNKQNSLSETETKNLDERNTNFKEKARDKQNLITESQRTERQNFVSERSMKGVQQNDISECQGQLTCDSTNKTKTKNFIEPSRHSILQIKDNMIKENANAKVLITPVFTDNSSNDNIAEKNNFPQTEKRKNNSSETNDCIIDIPDSKVKLSNVEENPMNNIQDEKLKPCLDTLSFTEPCCRVCQCNGDEEILINPCNCSGSVKWVHESCLVQWMKSSFKDSCELCLKKIQIAKRVKPLSKVGQISLR